MHAMKLERLLQIAVATLVSMGALLLGTGQQVTWLPVMAIVVASSSVYLNDHLGSLRLPRNYGNALALVAVAVAMVDLAYQEAATRILAIANLLVYLQCVLLYQRKSERNYWQLIALSLLQVVVASALNLGMEYGFLLAFYSMVAITSMVLLVMYHECRPYYFLASKPQPIVVQAGGAESAISTSPMATAGTPHTNFDPSPLVDEPTRAMINPSLMRLMSLVGFTAIAFGVSVFFMFPRFRDSAWRTSVSEEVQRLTGFSDEMSLNDIGSLLESPELVMRAWFYNRETKEPYTVLEEPYFRGHVMIRYSRGRWLRTRFREKQIFTVDRQPKALGDMVRQEITLQPQRSFTLFSVAPSYEVASTPKAVQWDAATCVLRRNSNLSRGTEKLSYTLDTAGFIGGRQVNVLPVHEDYTPQKTHGDQCLSLRLEDGDVATLRSETERVLTAASASRDDPYDCAKALERYFLILGGFSHSLVAPPQGRGRDPTVEFLTSDGKAAHCEFFSSALALMLRTIDIPSRVVIGYKGAEYNSVGDYYQVRQLNTHAWVEAYLSREQLPPSIQLTSDPTVVGAWLQLDPTPEADENQLAAGVTLMERLGEFRDYVQLLWNDYVLGLDSQRQRETVYEPIRRWVKAFVTPESWSYFFHSFRTQLANMLSGKEFSWRAGLLVMIMGSALVLAIRLLRPPIRWLIRSIRDRRSRMLMRKLRRIEFYQRLERLLAKHGHRRRPQQTHREFALAVSRQYELVAPSPLARITNAFYRVRFGAEELSQRDARAVEAAIGELEDRLVPEG